MSRARLNLVIDASIGIAFLVTAVTGVVFLLPVSWQTALGLGMPGMLGVPLRIWHWLHDWSGVVAAAGVTLHFALHYKWFCGTARRWIAGPTRSSRSAARAALPAASVRGATTETAPRAVSGDRPYAVYSSENGTTSGASDGPDEGLTRRGFVAGLAGVAAGVAGGAVVVKVASAMAASRAGGQSSLAGTSGQGNGNGAGASGSGGTGSNGSGSNGSASSGSTGSAPSSSGQSGSGQSARQARVAVDSSSCTSCGRCLQTCPASVFAWDGSGKATAAAPDQCVMCHRCVQVCPASAITLNG